jgi:hypothetical protein
MPPPGAPSYPSPEALGRSSRDADIVALNGLIELKLRAHRYQDLAGIVALMQDVSDLAYTEREAGLEAGLRHQLATLRRDAREEKKARDRP